MLILFPLVYLSSFFAAVNSLIQRNKQGILIFLIFGLPIYTTSMSVALQSGLKDLIPLMQPCKELLVLSVLGISVWELKRTVRLQTVDYLILIYFCYTLAYVFLPIGEYGILQKAVAFKSSAFFVFVYLAGRLLNPEKIYLSKYFHYILVVSIAAVPLLLYEIVLNQHFQSLTGYADFNYYFYNQEASGNYDLSWTFETSTGLKRFASFFANPIEFGAATLLALSVIAGLYTTNNNRFKPDTFGLVAIVATQISIFLALSRASLASYFIMIYVYAILAKRRMILNSIHLLIAGCIVYAVFFLFYVKSDLAEFIVETITFTNPSSVGHVIAWLEGIEAMITNPFGIGLGQSGLLAVSMNDTTGGENQYIIIGVQTGILMALLYMLIQVFFIKTCWQWFPRLKGKEKKICLTVLLIKIGLIIPLMTSEIESSVYISYVTWFFSGLCINIIERNKSGTPAARPKIIAENG